MKEEISGLIKLLPAVFSEIYHERRVNNIYLDSLDMKSYFDNIAGAEKRVKVRVRWYGDMSGFIKDPVLELKAKQGPMCNKVSFPLAGFRFDENFSIRHFHEALEKCQLPDGLKLDLVCLNFSLLNSYKRQYYLSADKNYRLTLDSGLQFYEIRAFSNTFVNVSSDHLNSIVEIKYGREHNDNIHRITHFFPFRMTRSSKYIMGIERLNLTKAYSHI
jgi:hypothetical protein